MNKTPERPEDEELNQVVRGERGTSLVARAVLSQNRLGNLLAMGLMLALGLAALVWYYGRQASRPAQLRQARQSQNLNEAATEMVLPPLGAISALRKDLGGPASPPDPPMPTEATDGTSATRALLAGSLAINPSAIPVLGVEPIPQPLLLASSKRAAPPATARSVTAARQRRFEGDVYAASTTDAADAQSTVEVLPAATGAVTDAANPVTPTASRISASGVPAGILTAAGAVPIAARRLDGRSLLLSKGTFIDCTLETAIDSTLPGITTCVTASDTFSADGRVVLMERGTRLFGETQGQIQQGSARVYVLWTEARTPLGVVVPLESPSSDELGRSGLPGTVQQHFWERFGAAILLSTLDGAVQAAVQASSRNSGTLIYNPGASADVMGDVLKSTVPIGPTVIKHNGDRIEVLVARDVDFRYVYRLQPIDAVP